MKKRNGNINAQRRKRSTPQPAKSPTAPPRKSRWWHPHIAIRWVVLYGLGITASAYAILQAWNDLRIFVHKPTSDERNFAAAIPFAIENKSFLFSAYDIHVRCSGSEVRMTNSSGPAFFFGIVNSPITVGPSETKPLMCVSPLVGVQYLTADGSLHTQTIDSFRLAVEVDYRIAWVHRHESAVFRWFPTQAGHAWIEGDPM